MAQLSQITQLEERRHRLVEESERYRQEIAGAVEQLRTAATWIETGYSLVRSIRSYGPLLAAAAGMVSARRGRSLLGLLGKGWALWRLGKRLTGLWAHSQDKQ